MKSNNNEMKTVRNLKVHSEHPADTWNQVHIETNETIINYRSQKNYRDEN
jgi:hypothetical protein